MVRRASMELGLEGTLSIMERRPSQETPSKSKSAPARSRVTPARKPSLTRRSSEIRKDLLPPGIAGDVVGAMLGCVDPVLTIAAAMSLQRSPFLSPFEQRKEAERARAPFLTEMSDQLGLLRAYEGWSAALKGSLKVPRVASAGMPVLRIDMFDYDRMSKNDFLGQVTFSPLQLIRVLGLSDGDAKAFRLAPKKSRGAVGLKVRARSRPRRAVLVSKDVTRAARVAGVQGQARAPRVLRRSDCQLP